MALVLMACLSLAGCEKLAYQQMNDASRNAWQKPKEVVDRLALKPGDRVADIGAGGG
jgi:cyclopropane fatty-acyl-phospholipid synthase-like methyltransferase